MISRWFKELRSTLFWRCVVAELLASVIYCFFATGTMFDVHQGLGSIKTIQSQITNCGLALGFLATVLSHGFGIMQNAFVFPSITFGKCLMKETSFFKSLFYFKAQMIGGIIGVSLDLALNKRKLKDGVIFPRLNISSESGCILEGILSILFVLAVLSTHEKKSGRCQGTPSLVFGFGVTVSFLVAYQKTGAVLNPAIVFGVGIVHNYWPEFVWIYWVGPLVGGAVGGLLYNLLLFPPTEKELQYSQKQHEKRDKQRESISDTSYIINNNTSSTMEKMNSNKNSRITKKLDLFENNVKSSSPSSNYVVSSSDMTANNTPHQQLHNKNESHTFRNPIFENEGQGQI